MNHPPYIRVGKDCVMRSVVGALDNIYMYLLGSLQLDWPVDWEVHKGAREEIFRRQIAEELAGVGVVTLRRSFDIVVNGRSTDIDVVALDVTGGVGAMFQLKWMEPFAHSMWKRRAKRRKWTRSVNPWIEKVVRWLAATTKEEKAAVLGVDPEIVARVHSWKIFAMGRWYSRFSDDVSRDSRAAWLSWVEFLESVDLYRKFLDTRLSCSEGPLDWLWRDAKLRELRWPNRDDLETLSTDVIEVSFRRE